MEHESEYGTGEPTENGKVPRRPNEDGRQSDIFNPIFTWPEAAVPWPDPQGEGAPTDQPLAEEAYSAPGESIEQPFSPALEEQFKRSILEWMGTQAEMPQAGMPRTREDLLRITRRRLDEGRIHMSRHGKLLTQPEEIVEHLIRDGAVFVGDVVTLPETYSDQPGAARTQ